MVHTNTLLEKFVKFYNENSYENKDLTVDRYELNGTNLKIKYSYLRDNISELDIKYGIKYREDEIEIHIMEYITFVCQIK